MNAIHTRLYALAFFLLVGFSMIWIIPKSGSMKPTRLSRHLPMEFGTLRGEKVTISGEELKILAKDTEFERVEYSDKANPKQARIEVSVVFSGKDLNNSIHRPERCLKAQGWNFTEEKKVVLQQVLPDGSDVPFRKIVCKKPVKLEDGKIIEIMRVQYYTFIGHSVITEDHYGRTFQDMKDRIFKGYDQQWAYVTFSMPVTQLFADQGLIDPRAASDLQESEAMLAKFIKQLLPLVIDKRKK